MDKICTKCKINKLLTEFPIKEKTVNGPRLHSYCKVCARDYQNKHYQKKKKYYYDKAKDFKRGNQQKLLDFLNGKSCTDCGINDKRVLEFDHLGNKTAGISTKMGNWSWERILTEIAKCEIVCCNCHRIRTLTRSNSYKINAE